MIVWRIRAKIITTVVCRVGRKILTETQICRSRQRMVQTVHLVTLTGCTCRLPLPPRRDEASPAPVDALSPARSPPPPPRPRSSGAWVVAGPRPVCDGGGAAGAGAGADGTAGAAFCRGETGTAGRGWDSGAKLDTRVTISRYLSSRSAWMPEPP